MILNVIYQEPWLFYSLFCKLLFSLFSGHVIQIIFPVLICSRIVTNAYRNMLTFHFQYYLFQLNPFPRILRFVKLYKHTVVRHDRRFLYPSNIISRVLFSCFCYCIGKVYFASIVLFWFFTYFLYIIQVSVLLLWLSSVFLIIHFFDTFSSRLIPHLWTSMLILIGFSILRQCLCLQEPILCIMLTPLHTIF
jgi:hypothetical protein